MRRLRHGVFGLCQREKTGFSGHRGIHAFSTGNHPLKLLINRHRIAAGPCRFAAHVNNSGTPRPIMRSACATAAPVCRNRPPVREGVGRAVEDAHNLRVACFGWMGLMS